MQCKQFHSKFLSTLLVAILLLTLFPAPPVTAYAADGAVVIGQSGTTDTVDGIVTAINYATIGNNTVTVTGTFEDADSRLHLNIPAGKTVVWKATLAGSTSSSSSFYVSIAGGGTLDVAEGGSITNSGSSETIHMAVNAAVKVSGGTVVATQSGATAINLHGTGAKAEVTGGTVKAVYTAIKCNDDNIVSVQGGIVSASANNGTAIDVSGASTVEISGTAQVTSNAYAIYIQKSSAPMVFIKGGEVTGGIRAYGGTISISGGTVSLENEHRFLLDFSSNAVISGGTLIVGSVKIGRNNTHTGAAYYTGERAGLFDDTFTAGTDLFKLDGVSLSTASGAYSYDGSTPVAENVVAAFSSDKLDLTGATVTATAGSPTFDNSAKTATFERTVNDSAITIAVTDAMVAGANVPFSFTTAAFGVNRYDNIKPTIIGITYRDSNLKIDVPLGASNNAPCDGRIDIRFSEPMLQTGNSGTVTLNPGNITLGGSWEDGSENLYQAEYNLRMNTSYTLTVHGFKDASGNLMDEDISVSFTTGKPALRGEARVVGSYAYGQTLAADISGLARA